MIREFFQYSLREQRGIILLIGLLFITLAVRCWPLPPVDHRVELVFATLDSSNQAHRHEPVVEHESSNKKLQTWQLTMFDINYAKAKELRHMGFSNQFISDWFTLKQSIGFVKSFEAFESLELLSDQDLQRVKPFLDFTRYVAFPRPQKRIEEKHSIILALNSCDTSELKSLPGIGTTFAKRIIAYRNLLGGFYSKQQLKEVYGIDSQLYNTIEVLVVTDEFHPTIDVNTATLNELKKHPYITYKQAKAITNYRAQHGSFQRLSDLNKLYLIDDDWLQKVRPYFKPL